MYEGHGLHPHRAQGDLRARVTNLTGVCQLPGVLPDSAGGSHSGTSRCRKRGNTQAGGWGGVNGVCAQFCILLLKEPCPPNYINPGPTKPGFSLMICYQTKPRGPLGSRRQSQEPRLPLCSRGYLAAPRPLGRQLECPKTCSPVRGPLGVPATRSLQASPIFRPRDAGVVRNWGQHPPIRGS